MSTSSMKVTCASKVLAQIKDRRQEALAGILTDTMDEESVVDSDSRSPTFDCFYANREMQTLLEMCNLFHNKFDHLWNICRQTFLLQKVTL